MNRIPRSLLLLIAVCIILPAVHAQDVRITVRPFPVGLRFTTSSDLSFMMTINMQAGGESQDMEMGNSQKQHFQTRVTSVKDTVMTGFDVTYDVFEQKQQSPMQTAQADAPAPVIGKKYHIDRSDSVAVSTLDGSAVTRLEKDFLSSEYSRHSFDRGFSAYIRDKTLHVGDTLAIDKALATAMFNNVRDEGSVRKFSMVLKETRVVEGSSCAVFGLAVDVSMNMGPLAIEMEISGEALVRMEDGWPVLLAMKGPIRFATGNDTVDGAGSGEISVRREQRYVKP